MTLIHSVIVTYTQNVYKHCSLSVKTCLFMGVIIKLEKFTQIKEHFYQTLLRFFLFISLI